MVQRVAMIARVSAAGASLTVLSSSGGATFSLAPALTSFVRGFRRQFLVGLGSEYTAWATNDHTMARRLPCSGEHYTLV